MVLIDALLLLILRYAEEHADGTRPIPEPAFEDYTRQQIRYHIEMCRNVSTGRIPDRASIREAEQDRCAYLDRSAVDPKTPRRLRRKPKIAHYPSGSVRSRRPGAGYRVGTGPVTNAAHRSISPRR